MEIKMKSTTADLPTRSYQYY